MHITASWEGVEEVVEVDEGCRSVAALLETVAAALPELDAETVCLEVGGCAADDEAVCGLCEGCVVTVSVLPAARAAATLREEGCEVDLKAFCNAARDNDLRLCRLYLEAGVGCEPYCHTPLRARDNTNYGLNDSGGTPLHFAAAWDSADVCKLLIDAGCALDVQNDAGFTPLHLAVIMSSVEVCKVLIDGGCRLDIQDSSGATPLDTAGTQHSQIRELLTDHAARNAPAK